MQIHVVQPGETIFQIAQVYSVSVEQLIESNEIQNANRLVVGQTIVIPIWGSYHWVQPGETIFSISRRYNVPVERLLEINQISSPEDVPVGSSKRTSRRSYGSLYRSEYHGRSLRAGG